MRVEVGGVLVLISRPTTSPGFSKTVAGSWGSHGLRNDPGRFGADHGMIAWLVRRRIPQCEFVLYVL